MKKLLLLLLLYPSAAAAQSVDCDQFPNSPYCVDAAPSPGDIQGAPAFACPGYLGYPGATSIGLIKLPKGMPVNCCDEVIVFKDGSILPPHPSADQATAQAWADDAYGIDDNTNHHYYLAWWTLFQISGVQCTGGAL